MLGCHCPVASHSRRVWPLHDTVLGVHTPVQTPSTHTELTHEAADCQWPVESQIRGVPLMGEQSLAPGTQLPAQAPLTQAELTQAEPICHCPVESQVEGTWPSHVPAPGEQTPLQLPDKQT